jgi:hypothetical protein
MTLFAQDIEYKNGEILNIEIIGWESNRLEAYFHALLSENKGIFDNMENRHSFKPALYERGFIVVE